MVFAVILVTLIKHTATRRDAERAYKKRRRTWRHSGLLERSSLSLAVLLYQLQLCHLINTSVSMRSVPNLLQFGAGCKGVNGRGITERWQGHGIATAIGNKEALEQGTLSWPG